LIDNTDLIEQLENQRAGRRIFHAQLFISLLSTGQRGLAAGNLV
jgi:hypothetical protein